MSINRRKFIASGTALFSALPVFKSYATQYDNDKAKEHLDPGKFLVRDGISFAKKEKKNNIPPVLREEILDNPNAVFIVRTDVKSQKDESGKFPAEREQFFNKGYETLNSIFRKGTSKGGTTYLQPNFVGGFDADERNLNNGTSTHPSYVTGFCKGLQELGNTNIVVGANGAAKHEHFVPVPESARCFTSRVYVLPKGNTSPGKII